MVDGDNRVPSVGRDGNLHRIGFVTCDLSQSSRITCQLIGTIAKRGWRFP
jgi:hypothetical protein